MAAVGETVRMLAGGPARAYCVYTRWREYPIRHTNRERLLMSNEHDSREIVTSAYDALARGDDDSFIKYLASDVEWIVPGPSDHPSTGTHTGKEALILMFARFSAFAELQELEVERVLGDDEFVVVLGRERWRVRGSGREFETLWANAVTLEDGLITRVTVYADISDEMAAFAGE